jgi:hypothetical protein
MAGGRKKGESMSKEKSVSLDYLCARCGRIVHEQVKYSSKELRERIEDSEVERFGFHPCSRAIFGITELVGYSVELED